MPQRNVSIRFIASSLFWLATLAFLSSPLCVSAQQRRVIAGGTITTGLTITAPQTIVDIHDATFVGAINIVFNIDAMASTLRPVWITITRCTFVNGAALYFSSSAAAVDTKQPVYITMSHINFTSGGLGFQGYYPPSTRIVLQDSQVFINSRASLLPLWNPFLSTSFAYWMALYNFYLRKRSSILFVDCYFGGTWTRGTGGSAFAAFFIVLSNTVSLADQSTLWIRRIRSSRSFFLHQHGSLYATALSTLVFEELNLVCDHFCISFEAGVISFTDRSVFSIFSSNATVPVGDDGQDVMFFESTVVTISSQSAFLVLRNNFTPYRNAFRLGGTVSFTTSTNSIASFYGNSFSGIPWSMQIVTNTGGAAQAQCNTIFGVPLRTVAQYVAAGLSGLTDVADCPRLASECQYTNSSCFMPGVATNINAASQCTCACNGVVGVGPHCLGTIRPFFDLVSVSLTGSLASASVALTSTESFSSGTSQTRTPEMTSSSSRSHTPRTISAGPFSSTVSLNTSRTGTVSATNSSSPTTTHERSVTLSKSFSHRSNSTENSLSVSRARTSSHSLLASVSASISAQVTSTQTLSVCANVTGSVLWDAIRVVGDNTSEISFVEVKRLDSNNNLYSVVVIVVSKRDALRSGNVTVLFALAHNLTMHPSGVGRRIAQGTNGLVLDVTNMTTLTLFFLPRGNEYVPQTANIEFPLKSVSGVCIWGRQNVRIELVLLPTTLSAMEAAQAVADVVAPLSVFSVSPSTSIATTRLSILASILECKMVDATDAGNGNNLLGLTVGPQRGASMRGAIVGNVILVVVYVACVSLIVVCFAAYGWFAFRTPISYSLNALGLIVHTPGIFFLPVAAICQPTMTVCVQLIVLHPLEGDRLFGIIGAAVVVLLMMLPFSVVISRQFCLVLAQERRQTNDTTEREMIPPSTIETSAMRQFIGRAKRFAATMLVARATWVPEDRSQRSAQWKKRFVPMFLDCGTWWYPLADMWMAAVVGVVGGVTIGNPSVCYTQLAVVALCYACTVFLQLLIAVPLVLASKCYTVALQGLGFVSCVALLVEVFAEGEVTAAVPVATWCMLAIAIMSLVKSVVDVAVLLTTMSKTVRKILRTVSEKPAEVRWRGTLEVAQNPADDEVVLPFLDDPRDDSGDNDTHSKASSDAVESIADSTLSECELDVLYEQYASSTLRRESEDGIEDVPSLVGDPVKMDMTTDEYSHFRSAQSETDGL
ncbi:DGF-1-like protein, putative [Bodo saltans]|uniref:DGF-1-like protein, putative n=1 Tax=Bodo saltans TaxID=75058 RepID=A0A0S4KGD4_BODSA|nr:DGF-1-like protein, putative [Bodo saltans]|eukprot:CUI14731.1 DGF-1-like protein, putative [Bodo saltans]